MNCKISVIVTVHNAEKTLRRCLESVTGQSFRETEILCMDGGSTDGTPAILQEYAGRDSRIRIIHDSNCSYGHKINRGISEAQGEYIAILESDDRMKEEMLERLYGCAQACGADYADADYEAVCRKGESFVDTPIQKYGSEACYGRVVPYEERGKLLACATGAVWTGLYRTSFLREHGIRMQESPGAAFQDTSFRFLAAMYAGKSWHSHDLVYEYTMDNPGSSIHDPGKIYAIPKEYAFLYEELRRRRAGKTEWKAYWKWKYESYYWNAARLAGEAREEFVRYYKEELGRDIRSGNLVREEAGEEAYGNTFLLLEDEREFLTRIERQHARGNLDVNILAAFLEKTAGRKIVLFGSGIRGQRFLKRFSHAGLELEGICDNDPDRQGSVLEGIKICAPREAAEKAAGALFVIPEGRYAEAMEKQLKELGIKEGDLLRFSV